MPWKTRLALVVGLISGPMMIPAPAAADIAGLVTSDAARQAVQIALETKPSGSIYAWRSQDGLVAGKVTLRRTFRATSGHFCREYAERVTDGTDTVTVIHIACRESDGSWVVAVD